ncbi:MAG: hypothetical protein SGILL_008401 [Bacillariaceae sp.]
MSTLKAGGSLKRKQTQSNSNSTSSCFVANDHANLPLAPRFPVPNHVRKETGNERPATATVVAEPAEKILPANHPFRGQLSSPSRPSSQERAADDDESSDWTTLLCSELDAVEECTLSKIQLALHEVLIPSSRKDDADTTDVMMQKSNDGRLWVDKYSMEHGGVVGAAATRTCQQLTEYINHWRKLRKEAVERMAERQRKRKAKYDKAIGKKPGTARKKRRKKKSCSDYDDDFLDDDEYWDDDELSDHNTPLCLLTGPPSSGKTSIVHHVAKQCLCSVVEINTTGVRSGAALRNALEEATKSSSLDAMLQTKENQAKANFFNVDVDSENEASGSTGGLSSSSKPNRDESSMMIVLLDEADIVFDSNGDSGFWAALSSLAKSAKSPIILTANQKPPQLQSSSLPCRFFSLERPGQMECATKILQICRQEGVELDPLIRKQGPDSMHKKLSQVASACDCDLRRMVHELQVFSYGHSGKAIASKPTSKEANPSLDTTSATTHWRPTIISIVPCKVPMDKHTVLTVKGRYFRSLVGNPPRMTGENRHASFSVSIGGRRCKSHIVDDETLMVLCPPYSSAAEDDCTTFCSRLIKRVVPLSIECESVGLFRTKASKVVHTEMMVNGESNIGIHWNLIEYVFPEEALGPDQLNESNDSVEEFEMDDETQEEEIKAVHVSELTMEQEGQGSALWESALSGLTIDEASTNIRGRCMETSQVDVDTLQALDAYSLHASMISDAAFLEDFQDGAPFLSGACRGFGFDFTEGCLQNSTGGDKLRFHDNSRP